MFCMHHTTCRGCFAQGPACSLPHAPAVDTLIELCALPCLCSTPLPSIVKGAPREQPQLACQSVHLCRRAAFCVSTHQALVSAASWGLWQGDYNEVQAIANTDGSSRWSKLSFGTSYVKGARHPKARGLVDHKCVTWKVSSPNSDTTALSMLKTDTARFSMLAAEQIRRRLSCRNQPFGRGAATAFWSARSCPIANIDRRVSAGLGMADLNLTQDDGLRG